jgi:hypothetical protein
MQQSEMYQEPGWCQVLWKGRQFCSTSETHGVAHDKLHVYSVKFGNSKINAATDTKAKT